jgi:hypothetical protein
LSSITASQSAASTRTEVRQRRGSGASMEPRGKPLSSELPTLAVRLPWKAPRPPSAGAMSNGSNSETRIPIRRDLRARHVRSRRPALRRHSVVARRAVEAISKAISSFTSPLARQTHLSSLRAKRQDEFETKMAPTGAGAKVPMSAPAEGGGTLMSGGSRIGVRRPCP